MADESKTETLLSPKELADFLNLPVRTIYAWRSRREGPAAMRIGKHVRFRRADVEAWLERQRDTAA